MKTSAIWLTLCIVFSGCATTPIPPQATVACGVEWQKGRVRGIALHSVDGAGGAPEFRELPPGRHSVAVKVTWSNEWSDQTDLQFEAQPDKWYWVLAYELAPGEPRTGADIRMHGFGQSLGRSALEGAAAGSAPLWLPIAAVYWGVQKIAGGAAPQERPFAGCCFVWVQEKESGVVIAGERP